MGRRGPPKKPTQLKVLQGVPGGAHKLVRDEPKPKRADSSRPPSWLCAQGKRVWRQLFPRLESVGLVTAIDVDMLARYCDVWVKWMSAKRFLDEHGMTYEIHHEQTPEEVAAGAPLRLKYVAQYPQVSIYREFGATLTRIEGQFGMSPAARAGLSLGAINPDAPRQSKNDTERFLFG